MRPISEMWQQVVLLSVLFILQYSISSQNVHYVKPGDSSLSCPGQPCLTLEQYALQTSEYFISGTVFLFFAGNHSLQTTINLQNVSNITLVGDVNNSKVMSSLVGFRCTNVTNLTVEGLIFTLGTLSTEVVFSIFRSIVFMNSLAFQGQAMSAHLFRALHMRNSTLVVESCLFERNSAINGGAIIAIWSNITLISSIFIANQAHHSGGAMLVKTSNLVIEGCVFNKNRAGHDGGAVLAHYSTVSLNGSLEFGMHCIYDPSKNNPQVNKVLDIFLDKNLSSTSTVFCNNEANSSGGAMSVRYSNISFGRRVVFENNCADSDGGALELSTVHMIAQHIIFLDNSAAGWGGAISVGASTVHFGIIEPVRDAARSGTTLFCRNKAKGRGGAISMVDFVNLTLSGSSVFLMNAASISGGAIYSDTILADEN